MHARVLVAGVYCVLFCSSCVVVAFVPAVSALCGVEMSVYLWFRLLLVAFTVLRCVLCYAYGKPHAAACDGV